jgi:TldD protein
VLFAVIAALSTLCAWSQNVNLIDILKDELDRNYAILKSEADPAPYYISYAVTEQQAEMLSGTLGTLQARNRGASRSLDVTVRVGSYKLDNYHATRGERPQFGGVSVLPVENIPDAIRRRLWLDTDRTLRSASQRFINLKTSTRVNVADADNSDDFSREEPSVSIVEPKKITIQGDEWAERVRRWSGEFAKYPRVLTSNVTIRLANETKYLVSTEGTRLQHGRPFVRITIVAQAKAADGMDLLSTDSFESQDPAGLPKDKEILAAVNKVAQDLTKLLDAPVVDPFVGPAILSGESAGVFFHEIFGHRIEGHRQKDETDGQTFTKSVNAKILPDFLSVVFDPTRKNVGSVDLNGTYQYDDEGVKARPVTVVDSGVLKTFLMSRSPIEGFSNSNGHGRRQPGREIVSRQSNLIVESSKQVPEKQLRQMLIDEMKRQNKPYGFYFQQVTGGYTTTGRSGFQSFKVLPLIVYRIYADGRPDELVRGVDIVGTPLASFARIVATSDRPAVFNGYCGAESGNVPVSAVSPSILISEIEIQKKEKAQDRPPLLTAPPTASGGGE